MLKYKNKNLKKKEEKRINLHTGIGIQKILKVIVKNAEIQDRKKMEMLYGATDFLVSDGQWVILDGNEGRFKENRVGGSNQYSIY